MKDFVRLQSSFLLCTILTLSERESVSVGCTSSMFWVVAEPTLLGQDHILHSDEASLGTGCPVTNVTVKGYEFNYPATECGIQKEVFSYVTVFYSALHCNIMHKGVTGKIPLMCIVYGSSSLDTTSSTIHNNLTEFQNDPPSTNSHSPWNLTNASLFGLTRIPYFQDSSVEAAHQSLLLNMSHPLVHESANVAIF
ncbi:oocyte-secreted protein 3 [Hylobates moloch]|uniref:oocyte-secreted protein 3 n=1 Tax=Hylobates moloch TaxID=81572 RepID=UPI002674A5AB|nr:oocyte-secreted protein 3 [Hylobates moloch]